MNTQGKYKVIRYRDNGQLEGESNWKDGKKDGLSKSWYEDGQLESRRYYTDGGFVI